MYQQDFPQSPDIFYLNHAAVGPWPSRTEQAVSAFAKQNVTYGATHYPKWQAAEDRLKQVLKQLINAESSKEIALAKNTSEALSIIAHGIPWQAGDNVVISDWEFPSNRIVWESLARYGVNVKVVACTHEAPEEQLMAACDAKTRLLSSSSVHYADGFTMDLKTLGKHCSDKDIYFCVDAIQSLGVMPFNARDIYADFVVADGHKWMLAPEGLALFYCRAPLIEKLQLHQYGWHMVEHLGDYDRTEWEPAKSARRFECGSPNMLAAHALEASLDYLYNEISIETVHDKISRNISYLIDIIKKNKDFELQTCTRKERLSGIINFKVKQKDNKNIYANLMREGLICAYRHHGIRLSPHFYQSEELLENAMKKLTEVAKR